MKRILVLLAVLALMLSLFAGCGSRGIADDGTNVSTTDNGVVNGANPNGAAGTGGNTGMGAGAGTGSGMDDAV